MAFTIHLISAERVRNVASKVLLKRYQWVSWPAALTAAVVPLILDTYRPTGGWCWITKYDEEVVLRWTSFYGILWFFFAWICYVYISLWLYMRDLPDKSKIPRMVYRLWIYPLVLLICYGPASIRRVWNLVGDPPYSLAVVHVCFASLHGFVNAMAYGRNRHIRALNKHLLDKTLGDCYGLREQPLGTPRTGWEKECKLNITHESGSTGHVAVVANRVTSKSTDEVPTGCKSGDKLRANVPKPLKSDAGIE